MGTGVLEDFGLNSVFEESNRSGDNWGHFSSVYYVFQVYFFVLELTLEKSLQQILCDLPYDMCHFSQKAVQDREREREKELF